MYCPNCGKENFSDQSYCRACGLKLGEITQVVADLVPSEENAARQRRIRVVEKMGKGALSVAGLIAVMSLVLAAALYKLILFGPEVLFWASAIALAVFAMLGAGLIAYSRLILQHAEPRRLATHDDELSSAPSTAKLIEDRPFEPVPSVVESTTDLLPQRSRSDQD